MGGSEAQERNAYDPQVILEAKIVTVLRNFFQEVDDLHWNDPSLERTQNEIEYAIKATKNILNLVNEATA